ncbi:protease-4 [Dysgonomonas sp. PFB1-18]|uniref:signal peptide peptidase SppA n=1 Tax=unclassified Dysgonomonas TaxID=2630389 RepID=UPI00247576EE|nr:MULTISPECIES: signal peptide peptidase SppA [unclassified Dysgonomonas]MDH6309962.1 protease-4 [Dysgonomonas sp. PF1-14]MDH6339872.1 protease-4 [Dysgonomonas sp. PF1-16]MDH6381520.1 protease-4 [Dysgonomonas sp. PFB1-18]MDH6398844.1 protease-4 [Dysgonomonas sp. PF1-23]
MKDFFKSLLASILGCFIVLGLLCLIMFISLAAMMSFSSEEKYTLKDNTILTLKLEGVLYDRVEDNSIFDAIMGRNEPPKLGLDDILSSIKKAKENDKIKGIYINAGAFSASGASLKEIRDQLIDFKESGKFVVSYADVYTQGCYYLSSVSDKVILNPQGNLDLHGYAAVPTFYKGLLDKIGVEMQIFKVGTFKSAVEPFMLDKMSDANKEQVSSYMNDMWSTVTDEISASRKISVAKLNELTDSLVTFKEAKAILSDGLVDTLMYDTGVKEYLKTLLKVEEVKDVRLASVKDITTVPFINKKSADDIIAVLYAEGSISDGTGREGITSKRYVKEIEKLRDNDKVKAVVFRVNSPGGSAYASEEIWEAIGLLKAKKPVVVSMGDYAASGGYYISCNASKIIAQPNTLTGSIGIFGMFPNVEGLTKKIGVSFDAVKTNKFSDFGNMTRPMREDEKAILQNYIERGYDLFLTRCSDGRGIAKDSLDHIAQGRVWTGNQALKIGLVDALGNIDTAIEEAAKLASLDDYSLRSFPKKVDVFESLLMNQKEELATKVMKEYMGADYEYFKTLKEIKEQDFVQARMPYDIVVK